MAIQNLLSLNFLVPFTAHKLDFSRAIRGLRGMPRRLLLIGHKLAAGTVPLNSIITVSTESDALQRFGEGSVLTAMWRAAKANADYGLTIDCVAIATAGGAVAATSTLVITNSAGSGATLPQAGEAVLYVAGTRVSVAVSQADTQATVATKMIAAINALPRLPVTAGTTANTNEVRLTARTAGNLGNDIDLRTSYYYDDKLPAGLSITTPAMSGGSGVADISPVITAMSGYRATEIVTPFTDTANMVLLENELAQRWLANNMQDGQAVCCVKGTESAVTTWLTARNSSQVHTIVVTKDCTPPWETAAMAGASIESLAATDPAQPHTGIQLIGYRGPSAGNHWTVDQMAALLSIGGSPLQIAPDYSGSLLRMVTNYNETQSLQPDRSMAELCWIKTMSYYRWFVVTEFNTKYRGFKLAQYIEDPLPGQKIMTPQLAEEIMLGIYKLFQDVALMQNATYYRDTLVVEVDGPNGKLKIQDEPVLVTQHYQTEITSYVVAGQV